MAHNGARGAQDIPTPQEPRDTAPVTNDVLSATSFLSGTNAAYLEQLYTDYSSDPASLDPGIRDFFEGLGDDPATRVNRLREPGGGPDCGVNLGPSWARADWPQAAIDAHTPAFDVNWGGLEQALHSKINGLRPQIGTTEAEAATKDSLRALMLIRAYRIRGHLIADLDPLNLHQQEVHPELDPVTYGFTESDFERPIFIDMVLGLEWASLNEIMDVLHRTYCGTFAVEFMHITDPEQKAWIQRRIEGPGKDIFYTDEGKKAIYKKLVETEGFEKFLQLKYTGTKRFGLDGGEAVVPALEQIIKRGGALGVEEISIGMPHRGRLNVLAAVMGKPYHHIFHEFGGGSTTPDDIGGSGDVKYHLGASSDREFDGNKVHLSLAANPSHLEAVDPVVLGKARAKQDMTRGQDVTGGQGVGIVPRTEVMPLLLHGDAAFAGQGIVAECFGFSGLKGYRTGGTIHVIVNNQIGFTTSPGFSRSSPYPSDVAKTVEAPIFHVNGDDPEAVNYAAKVATEYRMAFGADVVIDMFCYRRFGHNEGDEPSFTQPQMYQKIAKQPTTAELYGRRLVAEGVATAQWLDEEQAAFRAFLEAEFEAGTRFEPEKADWLDGAWAGFSLPEDDERRGQTMVPMAQLREIGAQLTHVPEGFEIHRTLGRILKAKAKTLDEGKGVDWATAEALAFGSLLMEGKRVRLSGQDSCRGTFSQRHAHFVNQTTEDRYTPLATLKGAKAEFEVIDSNLSEFAVMGFEYGYSLSDPNCLCMWEAQFGDFANGAQVIVDQFISSGERKWLRMSGLVLLLPHGYEGQGPEHSSARLERYLQLCAEDNMQVANCTTPANYFHILRRQMTRKFRKPLVLMTPKSLLRHKRAVSTFEEMSDGSSFHRVLWDDAEYLPGGPVELVTDEKIRRVVLCSGKVYYDLLEEREARGINDVYLMRVEQLYPFPAKSLIKELSRFKQAEIVWCQEEPKNMGAWFFMEPNLEWTLAQIAASSARARYCGRKAAASPATGLMSRHKDELAAFLDDALHLAI